MSTGLGTDLLAYASAGMSAQRAVLNLDAENVARSQAASPAHPVRELVPVFGSNDDDPEAEFTLVMSSIAGPFDAGGDESDDAFTMPFDDGGGSDAPAGAPQVIGVRPGRAMTGNDAITEMVGVLDAQRAYESDAALFDTGKSLISRTIDLERT